MQCTTADIVCKQIDHLKRLKPTDCIKEKEEAIPMDMFKTVNLCLFYLKETFLKESNILLL